MWVWEKLSAAKWLDAWEERFRGDPGLVIHVLKGGRSLRVQTFRDREAEAREIVERFGGRVRPLRDLNWESPTEVPPPLRIRDRFLITQDAAGWQALCAAHEDRDVLCIPPEMAFGTGDHATTATCMRFLVDLAKRRRGAWSCADLGSGTGLLAVAAARLGAAPIYACDFDPFAVTVTRRNAERHAVDGIEIEERDVLQWQPTRCYDVLLANLFSTVLIEAFPAMRRGLAAGGDLIISGILKDQAWEVFEAAARAGFGFTEVVTKGKWVTARGGWMADLASSAGGPVGAG